MARGMPCPCQTVELRDSPRAVFLRLFPLSAGPLKRTLLFRSLSLILSFEKLIYLRLRPHFSLLQSLLGGGLAVGDTVGGVVQLRLHFGPDRQGRKRSCLGAGVQLFENLD